jgi:hypothetical protein
LSSFAAGGGPACVFVVVFAFAFLGVIPEGDLLFDLLQIASHQCPCAISHPPIRKFTVMVVCTSIVSSFNR